MSQTASSVSTDQLARARRSAHRARSEALLQLHQGQTSIEQLIWRACEPDGKPLLSLRLHRILDTAPGIGKANAGRLMRRFCRVMGEDPETMRSLTIAWLITPRSAGRRREVWMDTVATFFQKPEPAWHGFPWAPTDRGQDDD